MYECSFCGPNFLGKCPHKVDPRETSLEEIRRKYNDGTLHVSLVSYVKPLLARIAELERHQAGVSTPTEEKLVKFLEEISK